MANEVKKLTEEIVEEVLQSAVMGGPKKDLPEFLPEEGPKIKEPLPKGV